MIILREAVGAGDLLSAATEIWDTAEEFPLEFSEIESKLQSAGVDMSIYDGIEDIIYKEINDNDILSVKLLGSIQNKGSRFDGESVKNIEYILSQIEINKINIKNKDLFGILCNATIYDRSQQDFKYTLYIADVLSDKNAAKKYFTDITDINVNLILDSKGNVLPATEIEKLIDELQENDGSNGDEGNTKYSIEDFLHHHKISGNKNNQINGLLQLIKKYKQRLNLNNTIFGSKPNILTNVLTKFLSNQKSMSQNMYKASINFLSSKFITEPAELLNSLQEIINYLHIQLTQFPKLITELETEAKKHTPVKNDK